MLLSELLNAVESKEYELYGDPTVSGLCLDSRKVEKGDLFFAIRGTNEDGTRYIRSAEIAGAVAVVCEEKPQTALPYIVVEDAREAMSLISCAFYRKKSQKLNLIAVTGTNGKTTTSHLIYRGLLSAGKKAGVIGTLGVFYAGKVFAPDLTTPDPIFLHSILADMADCGVEYVVMEVSAHALQLKKIAGLHFSAGVLTNITEDHLDDFHTMDAYISAKKSLFTENFVDVAVLSQDDPVGVELAKTLRVPVLTYGLYAPSDVFAIDLKTDKDGTSYVVNLFDEVYLVRTNLLGAYNVQNQIAAASVLSYLGVPMPRIARFLSEPVHVEGRMEKVAEWNGGTVFVDFAHTPDGLEKALKTLREITEGRLICLFGCGGNREREKRSLMGKIAGTEADFVVLTSDNPRYEDPLGIIAEAETGLVSVTKEYVTVQDRRAAIGYAIGMLKKGDTLLLAGKGGEEYQEIMGVQYPFNDKKYVSELLG